MRGGRHRGRAGFITGLTLMVLASQAVVGVAPAFAATFNVDSTADAVDAAPGDGICATGGGQCTLRAAIQEANALAGADTINIPAGTYTLTIAGPGEDAAATGDLDLSSVLTLTGAGASSTIIDGGALDRVFEVSGGSSIVVSDVTIRNGAVDLGAGVRVTSASLTLDRTVFTANAASDRGGAIHASGSSVNVTDSSVSGNTSTRDGGGIFTTGGTMTLDRVTVSGNDATTRDGGGLFNGNGVVSVTNSTFSGNTSGDEGGGIRQNVAGSIEVRHSTISGNTAPLGDGVFNGMTATFENTIIADNGTENCQGSMTSDGYNIDSANTCGFAGPGDQINTDPLLGPLADNGGPTQTHAIGAGSPALDTASPTCPATDQRGITRPQGPSCDSGAFEYEPPVITISGTVFDDLVGDGLNDGVVGDVNNPGVSGVDVYLYADDGDNVLDAGDALAAVAPNPASTDGSGNYTFSTVSDGTYFVVVDSKTVPSAQDPAAVQTDIWAEQTYGSAGAHCTDGATPVIRGTAGSCYAGETAGISDDATGPATAEHYARVTVSGAAVSNIDFGFSFNVVTTALDSDDDLGANRTKQGSVRQLIQNANAIADANAMRFHPVGPTNGSGGGGTWWRLDLVVGAMPALSGSSTTIDGTAYCAWDDGTSGCAAVTQVRETNPGTAGNSGAAVGTGPDGIEGTGDEPTLGTFNRPELEINAADTGIALDAAASSVTIRRIGVYNTPGIGIRFSAGTGGLIEESFVGARADGTAPAVGDEVGGHGIRPDGGEADVRNNLAYYTRDMGIRIFETSTVEGNDVYVPNLQSASDDGIALTSTGAETIVIRGNRIEGANGYGIESWNSAGPFTIEDNTVVATGFGGGPETGGIRVMGQGSTVRHNVVRDVAGAGITVVETAPSTNSQNRISENAIYRNGGPGIDIDVTNLSGNPNGDGVTPNDGSTNATLPNIDLDYPVLTVAEFSGTNLHIEGYVGTSSSMLSDTFTIEVFRVDTTGDPGTGDDGEIEAGDLLSVRHGEGRWFINSCTLAVVGTFACDLTVPAAVPLAAGDSVTATATDSSSNSSEFGANATVTPGSLVVNSTGDGADLVAGNGACNTGGLNSQGATECTLRAAIEEANAYAGANAISFDIPTTEPGYSAAPLSYTIQPATALPSLTDPVTLNATTQPDFPGTPIIQLDGSLTMGGANGFLLQADSSTIRGFVINRFADEGVDLFAANGNTIAGNYIGTDVTGSVALANGDIGVLLNGASANNMIGGTGPSDRNVISGNTSSGVAIRNAGSDDNSVVGNYIGVNAAGTGPLGNGGQGVELTDFALNTIVGDPAGPPNVISANGQAGISLTTNATGAIIRGNLIGTDVTGLAGLGNTAEGVFADADNVTIGGPGAADGNVVSDNGIDGLRLERLNAIVQGNLIGTDATGSGPLGNTDDGIDTGSGTAGSLIGGLGANEPNTIAYNGDLGLAFRNIAGLSGAVLRNSIYGNGSLGIDLATNGITPNDPGDVDGGPNGLLNFPVITSAGEAGGTVIVDFDLDLAAGDYRVEFFDNPSGADPSGNGEGEVLVSSVNIAHTGSGVESFSHSFLGSAGDVITTTNTHCTNPGCTAFDATSEFSGAVTVILLNSRPVLDPIGAQSGDEGTLITFTATA
ncbi:MAG: choice-of-anchor Q domain-containing protein, partial [Acidimicrobiia bacterium]